MIRLGNPWLSNCFTLTYMRKMQTKNTTTNRNYWESVSHLHFLQVMSAFSLHFKFMYYVHLYIDCIHYERYKEIEKYNPCSEKFIPNWPTWRLLHSSHMIKGFIERTFKVLKHGACGTFAGRKHWRDEKGRLSSSQPGLHEVLSINKQMTTHRNSLQ